MPSSTYKETPISEIYKTLTDLFQSLDTPAEVAITQSYSSNFIIFDDTSSEKSFVDSTRLAEELSAFHPGRYFVIGTRSASGIAVDVSVTCRQISKSEQICSEIIRIVSDSGSLAAVPSIVKASLLTGVPTEFLIASGSYSDYIKMFYPIADLVIFDSDIFWNDASAIEELNCRSSMLLDLQWIALSPWREQLKSVFDRPAVKNSLKQGKGVSLFDIDIEGAGSRMTESLLLAGWLLTRLRLEPTGFGGGRFECVAPDGGIARLRISRLASKLSNGGVQSLSLLLKERSRDTPPTDLRISIKRTSELLETEINTGEVHKMSSGWESEDLLERLKKFFLIGESTANYPSTLKAAIDLNKLRQGYGDF